MDFNLQVTDAIYFDPDEHSPEDYGLTEDQMHECMKKGQVPVKYNKFTTPITIKNSEIAVVFVDQEGLLRLLTKAGTEFTIIEEDDNLVKIKEIIEFGESTEHY